MTSIRKKIDFNEVDFTKKYKISSLFSTLALIATQNAIEIGMWNDDMNQSYGWVLAKQSLILDEPICLNDEIDISTCVDKGSFVVFPRNYYIKKDHKLIGTVSSLWTLIDIKKRTIVSPKRLGLHIPDIKCDYPLQSPITIKENRDFQFVCQRQVMYSDVDTNLHMNNARYLQWACDLIDFSYYEKNYINKVNINYKKEIPPLSTVDLYLCKEDHCFVVKGCVQENTMFLVEIFLKK